MDKTSKSAPVSSTPYLKRNAGIIAEIFEDTTLLSPVVQRTEPTLHSQARSKPVIAAPKCLINIAGTTTLPKKRRQIKKGTTNKEDPASNAVLKELEVKHGNRSLLSHSRHLYNMFPEPIILDSDEEESLVTTTQKKPVTKKIRSVKPIKEGKNNAKENKIRLKEKLDKVPVLFDSDEEECLVPQIIWKKPSSSQANRSNSAREENTISKDSKEKIKKNENRGNNEKTEQERRKKSPVCIMPKQRQFTTQQSSSRNGKKAEKKLLYDNIANICSEGLGSKIDRNSTNSEQTKDHDISGSSIVYLGEKRSKKNKFPTECLSFFENVIFKHNKNCGALVAKSLETEKLNFGYVEVEKGHTFSGHRQYITFVLLEGQVEAFFAGASQILSSGDILHINQDSGYQFKNSTPNHARLLYVLEKCTEDT